MSTLSTTTTSTTTTTTTTGPTKSPPPPPIVSFLDPHLAILYLSPPEGDEEEDEQDEEEADQDKPLSPGKRALLPYFCQTKMIDYTQNLIRRSGGGEGLLADGPFASLRSSILTSLTTLKGRVAGLLQVVEAHSSSLSPLDPGHNIALLKQDCPELDLEGRVEDLYQLALLQYDVGSYSTASESLYYFGLLSLNRDKLLSALWGKLAADTLDSSWDACLEDVSLLAGMIEARGMTPLLALQARACLMHWACFAWFSSGPRGFEAMVDLCLDPLYFGTIQMVCPWLLSHLSVAILFSKQKKAMKEFLRLTGQDQVTLPLVAFVRDIQSDISPATIDALLPAVLAVIAGDRFMAPIGPAFTQRLQVLLFEVYAKLHTTIHIPTLVGFLARADPSAKSPPITEKWIVELVQALKMDGTIDQVENTLSLHSHTTSVYQSIIEKTKSLAFRSTLCAVTIEKREAELAKINRLLAGGTPGGPVGAAAGSS